MSSAAWVLGALAFAAELLLWVGIAVAIHGWVGGALGWALGAVVAVVVVVAWSVFLAPRANRRLPALARAVTAGGSCVVVGVTLLADGPRWWGWALLIGAVVMVAAELHGGPPPEGSLSQSAGIGRS